MLPISDILSTPLAESEQVKELLAILRDNDVQNRNLTAILDYVRSMEEQLSRTAEELQALRTELGKLREERNHPIATALRRAGRTMEQSIQQVQERLNEVKEWIVQGSQDAVAAFKERGVSALHGLAEFLRLKPALESLRSSLQEGIANNQQAIAKVEAVATECNTASRHVKNVGRVLLGREPVTAVKPNGRLAKLMEAPFRIGQSCMRGILKDIERANAALERLEKAATPRVAEKGSVRETMRRYKVVASRGQRAAPEKLSEVAL